MGVGRITTLKRPEIKISMDEVDSGWLQNGTLIVRFIVFVTYIHL